MQKGHVMFLFCKWFSKLNTSEKIRSDTEAIVDEILNQSGKEQ